MKVDAKAEVLTGSVGFSEDVAVCDRAPATALLQDNSSKNFVCGADGGHKVDTELATEFNTFFMGEFGWLGRADRESGDV